MVAIWHPSDFNIHEMYICFLANCYIIKIRRHLQELQEDFDNAMSVNISSLIHKEAGSIENFEFKPEAFKIDNGTKLCIAIQAISEANLTSDISNIVQATNFIPPQKPSIPDLGTKVFAISLAILGLVVILSIF